MAVYVRGWAGEVKVEGRLGDHTGEAKIWESFMSMSISVSSSSRFKAEGRPVQCFGEMSSMSESSSDDSTGVRVGGLLKTFLDLVEKSDVWIVVGDDLKGRVRGF